MADIFNYGVPLKGLNTRQGQFLEQLRNNEIQAELDNNLDLNFVSQGTEPQLTFAEKQMDFLLNQPHTKSLTVEGLGESSYDEDILTSSQLDNLEDTRARMQSNFAKIGNGVAKGAILAGTTFLDGTLGLLVGLPTAIGEGRFSGIWDNDFSKAMQAVNEASEEWLPNYYTQQEREEPWYENIFTANFLGDKFIKNLGFTIGAFGSGNIASMGIKAMKIPQAVRAFQGAKAMKAYRNYRAVQKAGDALDTAKALTKFTDTARKASQMPAMVTSTVGATVSAINEGRIEALNNSRDWFNTQKAYIDDYYYNMYGEDFENFKDYQDALIKLSDDRAKMGNLDMLMNVPILMASNLFQFGRLYANGFKTSKHAKNIVKKNDLYDVNMSYGKNVIGKTLADAAAEGTEEVTQKMAATISGLGYEQDIHSFVENKEDKNAEDQTIDWMKAFAQGINDTVNNSSTWEEFFIGALTGALGMPRFRSAKDNSGKIQSPIYFDGGIWGNHKQYREDLAREKEIANYLNNRVQSPEFLNYYRGFIRHKKYDNEMDKAAEENKPFEFKNAEHSQLLSDIIMFDNAGKLEDLNILIDNAFDTSDENLQSIVENTSSSVGEDVVGPFMEGKNPMYATEEGKQKMIDKLTSTRDQIKAKIQDYLAVKSEIEFMTDNQLSDDQEEELIHMQTSINDWIQRHNKMSDELRTMLSYSTKAIHNKLTELNEELQTGANNRPRKIVEEEKQNLEAVQGLISGTLEIGRGHYANLSKNEEMLNILDGIIDNTEGVNEAEKQQAKDRIQDLIKVNEAIKEYQTKLKEYIANPQKQVEAQTKSKEKKKKIEQAIKNEEKVEEISNKSVSELNALLRDGKTTMEELEALFPKTDEGEQSENQKKVQEVKSINTIINKTKQAIDSSNADSQTKKDAKRLLDKSIQVSNSVQEFLNFDSEIFNDGNNLLIEGEPIPQVNLEEMEFTLSVRGDNARTLLSELTANVIEEIEEAKKYGTVVRTFGEEDSKPSGKDGQDTQKPINAAKPKSTAVLDRIMEEAKGNTDVSGQPLTAKVREVLNTIDGFAKINTSEPLINDIVKKKTFYKEAIAAMPALEQKFQEYIKEQVDKFHNKKQAEQNMSTAERKEQKDKENIPPVETSKQQLQNESNSYKEAKDTPNYVGGMSLSWFSGITEYPIHQDKGDFSTLKTWVDNQNYSEQVKNRIKAVWNYLKIHNAFDYISNNNLKVGNKITFGTNNALNKEAGETIIIIYKKNSDNSKTPIGILRPKSEANLVAKQAGLATFIEQFEEAWEKAGMPVDFYFGETTVNNNLIGRVAFEEDGQYNTLNTIAQGKPFTLGIAVGAGQNAPIKIEAGRRASQGLSAEEQTILTPLDAVSGKPYLLIETSDPNRKYMPVAISMPRYSAETANSRLGRAIEEVLSTLPTLQADKSLATKESLMDLIYFHDMFIQVKDGNLTIKTKDSPDSNWVPLYTGPQNNPNLIEIVKKELYNRPFQISRKYINEDYKDGQSYNEMIGELAETNVAIGRLHTINDWFTINPVGVKRAPSFETTGNNPHYATPANVEINYKGNTYTVDLATFGESNPSIPLEVKAMAYAQKNNLSGIFNTPFGWFDSSKNIFTQSPVIIAEESSTLEDSFINQTIRDYTKEAKSKGLLGDKVKEKIWELLNDSQKQALLDSGGRMPQQLMDKIKSAYDARTNSINEKKLGGSLDQVLKGEKHREDSTSRNIESQDNSKQIEKELAWLSKVLPNLNQEERVRIVEGLIRISQTEDKWAYGRFKRGIIEIGTDAARGTVYHEAFHAVVHTLLNDQEYESLFNSAKDKYGDLSQIELEEKLAEDFRRYTQINEIPVIGSIAKFFGRIKNIVKSLLGKDIYIDNLFYRINNQYYADRTPLDSNTIRNKEAIEDNVQVTLDSWVNNRAVFKKGPNSVEAKNKLGVIKDNYQRMGYKVITKYNPRTKNVEVVRVIPNAYNREVEQYHKEKNWFGKLSEENKQYILDRGISIEEYNKMSPLMKEVLFHCK